jgi:hypothetical protein
MLQLFTLDAEGTVSPLGLPQDRLRPGRDALPKPIKPPRKKKGEAPLFLPLKRALPPPPPAPRDAEFWKVKFTRTLESWQAKDYGPCPNCYSSDFYAHMGFTFCRHCLPPHEEKER